MIQQESWGEVDFYIAKGRDTLRCGESSGLGTYKFAMIGCNGLMRWGQGNGSKISEKVKDQSSSDQGQVREEMGSTWLGADSAP